MNSKPADKSQTAETNPLPGQSAETNPLTADEAKRSAETKPLTEDEAKRLAELRAKARNPDAPAPNTRTPEEEAELARLEAADKAAADAAAAEAARPVIEPTARERLAELDGKAANPSVIDPAKVRSEGEEVEYGRLRERVAKEDRLAELRKMTARTPEQDAEIVALEAELNA